MAKIDMYHSVDGQNAFDIQAISGDKTTDGNIIDTLGFESILFVIHSGTIAGGVLTPLLRDGDDSGLSDVADVDSDFLLGTYAEAKFTTTVDNNKVKTIGCVCKKRYIRLSIVSTGTADGTIGSSVVLGNALHQPTQGVDSPTG